MDSSLEKDGSEEKRKESGETASTDDVQDEQQPAGMRRLVREQIDALAQLRKRLFEEDVAGRTPLFRAAEKGLEYEVREIIFSLRGTGLAPPRLALIATKDVLGLTAADVAEQNGHEEIADLLRSEQGRMEFFE